MTRFIKTWLLVFQCPKFGILKFICHKAEFKSALSWNLASSLFTQRHLALYRNYFKDGRSGTHTDIQGLANTYTGTDNHTDTSTVLKRGTVTDKSCSLLEPALLHHIIIIIINRPTSLGMKHSSTALYHWIVIVTQFYSIMHSTLMLSKSTIMTSVDLKWQGTTSKSS